MKQQTSDQAWQLEFMHGQTLFIEYWIDFACQHELDFALLKDDVNNLLDALQSAYEMQLTVALVRGVHCASSFYMARGMYSAITLHLQRVLQISRQLDDIEHELSFLLRLGQIARHQGRYEEAEQYFLLCLKQETYLVSYPLLHNSLLREMGLLMFARGYNAEAERYFDISLMIARQLVDKFSLVESLQCLGILKENLDELDVAYKYYEEGLQLSRQSNSRKQECGLLANMSAWFIRSNNFDKAHECIKEGILIASDIGDYRALGTILENGGIIHAVKQEFIEATNYFRSALELAQKMGHLYDIVHLLINLGELSSDQGKYTEARQYFIEALNLSKGIDRPDGLLLLHKCLGSLEQKENNNKEAIIHFEKALALAEKLHILLDVAEINESLATVYRSYGESEKAKKALEKILALQSDRISVKKHIANAFFELAKIAEFQGNHTEALKLGEKSLSDFQLLEQFDKVEVIKKWLLTQQEVKRGGIFHF